jgi:hypothetical protein
MKKMLAALGIAAALAVTSRAAEKTEVVYRFREGDEASYELKIELDTTSSATMSGREEKSTTKTTMSLDMDMATHTAEAAELTVAFKNLKLSQTIGGPAGQINVEVEGEKVKVTRGGATVIDTEKKVGVERAPGLTREFSFLGKDGTVVVDDRGRIVRIDGPEAFTRFVSADTGVGLFVLETPTEAVAAGESWTSTEKTIKSLRGLDLSGDPIELKTTYTLEAVAEDEGARIATISVKSSVDIDVGLSGRAKGGALNGKSVSIPRLTRSVTGTVHFDLENGKVVDSEVSVEMTVKIEVGSGEEKVASALEGTAKISTKLK